VNVSYVLPVRWERDEGFDELTAYLGWLSARAEVIVVDGSSDAVFAAHRERWSSFCRHVRPDPRFGFANGKVTGVHTGMALATNERVVIADDDVRYDDEALRGVATLLDGADIVRPQNYFDPAPWHARWDTARTLLNRAFARDWPGTFGMRASTFRRMGGYDGDVLFENLELVRTVRAAGGREEAPLDLYVRRRPPSVRRFASQRVRQAYDEFARPPVLALWLLILPVVIAAALLAGPMGPAGIVAGSVVAAEVGRRREGGRHIFPATASLLAPGWVLERIVASWVALAVRVMRGGVPYAGSVITRAGTPKRRLAETRAPIPRT
jgi:hypothetical protein